MEGTQIVKYVDGKFFDAITYGGLAPSIITDRKLFPDLSEEETDNFKNGLINGFKVPVEEKLIIVAKSLWYRCEYRSAIIESSAALEIAVEKKLINKMESSGMTQSDIEKELAHTETNFKQRCDHYLEKYTGKSFIKDNESLWLLIDNNRKDYRNKITHSDKEPDRDTTESIIENFNKGIQYIKSL